MIWVDYCLLALTLVSVLVGILRGFAKELLSVLTWGLAIVLAWLLGDILAGMLVHHISVPALRIAAAYSILFLAGLLVGALMASFIVDGIRNSRFSSADRTLGGGVGLLRGVFLGAVFVLLAGTMGASQDRWYRQSLCIPVLEPLAAGLKFMIPERWLEKLKPDQTPEKAPAEPAK